MSIQLGPPPPGFVADLPCAENEARRGRSFGFAPAFPSAGLSYQALTFYPALTYGVYADRILRAILGLLDFGNGGLSGIIYRIKVASVLGKQGRHNARGVRFGKIADTEFHARKIKRQPLIGNSRLKAWRRCHAPELGDPVRPFVHTSLDDGGPLSAILLALGVI